MRPEDQSEQPKKPRVDPHAGPEVYDPNEPSPFEVARKIFKDVPEKAWGEVPPDEDVDALVDAAAAKTIE